MQAGSLWKAGQGHVSPEDSQLLNYPVLLSWGRRNNISETVMLIKQMPLNSKKPDPVVSSGLKLGRTIGIITSSVTSSKRAKRRETSPSIHTQVGSMRISRNARNLTSQYSMPSTQLSPFPIEYVFKKYMALFQCLCLLPLGKVFSCKL